ncbi:Hypothetical predicted protein [Lecanosticta acicola]|uniref:Putative gamma-glutamylcyclotransferase n=1 Tax=Lecanosticta acicola TaxID=111012 RepID=A0AAI8YZ14_9PEZI|nr:Hypothetical predicted protein [Lecanosticta acicola]
METKTTTSPGPRAAFFYGTLMAPQVLHRVCHGSMSPSNPIYTLSSLTTTPALLPSHRRHRVKNADYPAILPTTPSDNTNASVRGTYVSGLTDSDIWRLDIFEGDEYTRKIVKVKLLSNDDDGDHASETGDDVVECETYIWTSDPERLEAKEWDFAEFQREKMRFWVGAEGEGEYAEVDEAVAAAKQTNDGTGGRGANGHITNALNEELKRNAV